MTGLLLVSPDSALFGLVNGQIRLILLHCQDLLLLSYLLFPSSRLNCLYALAFLLLSWFLALRGLQASCRIRYRFYVNDFRR